MTTAYLPPRREAKAVRSRALHAARITKAATPEAKMFAAIARLRAVYAAASETEKRAIADQAAEWMGIICDRAEERAVEKARRRQHARPA